MEVLGSLPLVEDAMEHMPLNERQRLNPGRTEPREPGADKAESLQKELRAKSRGQSDPEQEKKTSWVISMARR